MIFIPDTSSVPVSVDIVIPTTRKSDCNSVTLSLVHETTKEIFAFTITGSENLQVYGTKTKIKFVISSIMPTGQYTYSLTDEKGILSEGLLQAGTNDPQITTYHTHKNIKVYEG